MKIRTTISIDEKLYKEISDIARKGQRSFSAQVNLILSHYKTLNFDPYEVHKGLQKIADDQTIKGAEFPSGASKKKASSLKEAHKIAYDAYKKQLEFKVKYNQITEADKKRMLEEFKRKQNG